MIARSLGLSFLLAVPVDRTHPAPLVAKYMAEETDPSISGTAHDDPNDWWHTRDRRLRGASIGLAATTGALALTAAGVGIAVNQPSLRHDAERSGDLQGAAVATGALALTSLVGLVVVGSSLAVHRQRGWRADPWAMPAEDPVSRERWGKRDRALRRATIGLAAFTGATALTAVLSFPVGRAVNPPCDACFYEGYGEFYTRWIAGSMAISGALALIGVGGAWAAYRERARGLQIALAPSGLRLRF